MGFRCKWSGIILFDHTMHVLRRMQLAMSVYTKDIDQLLSG